MGRVGIIMGSPEQTCLLKGLTIVRRSAPLLIGLILSLLLGACAQNPVTGKKEILLVSESWELSVGRQQYSPLRQAQGGDYVVDPRVEAYVRQVGNRLAAKSDRKLPYEFNVINDSTPNAWALPGGKISINRGLLVELGSEAELAAVLGHEIVHAAAKHGTRGQTRGIALQAVVMTASIAGARNGYGELAQVGSMVGAQIINSKYGRDAELESDRYGMEYMARAGYDPSGAVDLQRTFVKLSEGRRSDWLSGMFASHPPSNERVKANVRTAASLPKGGDVGRDRYRNVMSRLIRTKSAYAAFDKAQALGKKGDNKQALALVRQAMKAEPKEGHFHSFIGDLASRQKDYRRAKQSYDRAISLNDEFFYYYLARAKVNQATRNTRAAQSDYAKSNALMPTSDAQTALGAIAQSQGKLSAAKRLYSLAARADGPAGQQARAALLKLDPPNTAVNSLLIRKGTSAKGTVVYQLINQTRRPISQIVLGIRTAPGKPLNRQRIGAVIQPGKRTVIDTGQRLSAAQLQRLEVQVLSTNASRL